MFLYRRVSPPACFSADMFLHRLTCFSTDVFLHRRKNGSSYFCSFPQNVIHKLLLKITGDTYKLLFLVGSAKHGLHNPRTHILVHRRSTRPLDWVLTIIAVILTENLRHGVTRPIRVNAGKCVMLENRNLAATMVSGLLSVYLSVLYIGCRRSRLAYMLLGAMV